jgi:hypothetical protein
MNHHVIGLADVDNMYVKRYAFMQASGLESHITFNILLGSFSKNLPVLNLE